MKQIFINKNHSIINIKTDLLKEMKSNNLYVLKFLVVMVIGLTLSFLSPPHISAATDTVSVEDTFKINEIINYKKPCFNNGTYCSAAATCNFTIYNPDNSLLINNQLGTNQGSYYNISFSVSNLGVYKVDMTCKDGTLTGAETLYFEVTGSGMNTSFGFYVIILLISTLLIAGGFLLKDAPVTILGTFGLYFIGIYILFNGIVGVKDLITTWALGIILLGTAGYISIRSAYELLEDAE